MGVQQLLSTLSALICHSLPRVHQPRQTGGMRLSPPAASGRDLAMQLATPCACAFAIAMEMCCLDVIGREIWDWVEAVLETPFTPPKGG